MIGENGRGFDVTTAQELARAAAERWKRQYFRGGKWRACCLADPEQMHDHLVSLGDSPTPEQVNATIGNDAWTAIMCSVCGKYVDVAMVFEDGDGGCANVCEACLAAGLEAVRNASNTTPNGSPR